MAISLGCRAWLFFMLGVVCMAQAAAGLWLFAQAEWFTDPGPYAYEEWQGYKKEHFVGLVFFTFLTTVGATFFFVGLQAISTTLITRNFGAKSATFVPTAFLAITLLAIAGVSIAWGKEILHCGIVGCTIHNVAPEVPNARPEAIWGWKGDMGVAALIATVSLTVARVSVVVINYAGKGGVSSTQITLSPAPAYWACTIIVPIVSALFFYISATYPNNWEYHSAPRLAAYLASVLFNEADCPGKNGSSCPELPGAWFRTHHWKLSPAVVMKIFPANVFFYVYLFLLGTIGVVTHQIQWSRKFLQRRALPKCLINMPLSKYIIRFTIGDVAVSFVTICMVLLFFGYWAQSHNFNGNWAPVTGDLIPKAERWARALGQLAIVFLSLLLFPASRNSIFHHPFGTHWESFLWTHRVLGTLMLLASAAHMGAWYYRFYQLGLFPHDIMQIPMTTPICIDNWTVPLVSLTTWFMLVAIGIGALPPIRRRFFEAFYYLHLAAAYSTIPAVLWHATTGWEYMLPGLTVWFIDRVVRFFRSGAAATVLDLTVYNKDMHKGAAAEGDGHEVLEIRFRPAIGMKVCPGQYVFLNIPQVSVLEWHPYTVSTTGTSSSYLTIHLKGMGQGTWSDRVVQLAASIQHTPMGLEASTTEYDTLNKLLQLNVDGPYGTPLYYNDYDQVVLIAGGIGITPCASILSGLRSALSTVPDHVSSAREDSSRTLNRNSTTAPLLTGKGAKRCRVRRVALKWSVRSMAEVDALSSALACSEADLPMSGGGTANRQTENFEQRCTIHATRGLYLDPPAGFDVQQGRPNYDVILEELCGPNANFIPNNTLVFVCGPTAMMDDAVRAASKIGCHVHTEVFEL